MALVRRPGTNRAAEGVDHAIIDSRTIRSTSGVDFHLRQILSDHLDPEEKAAISLAFRSVRRR